MGDGRRTVGRGARACLRERNFALCTADTGDDDGDDAADALASTADWGYLRLRRDDYGDDDLTAWAGRIRETGWDHAFVFFKTSFSTLPKYRFASGFRSSIGQSSMLSRFSSRRFLSGLKS